MKGFGILAVLLIIISSASLFFYLQDESRKVIKQQLLEEQKERQLRSTGEVASHIGSDLTLIVSILDGISNSKYLQDGEFYGSAIKALAAEKYSQVSTIVDSLFILNKEDVVVFGVSNSGSQALAPLGNDLSFRTWVRETKNMQVPIFSEGFEAVGEYRVFITSPVINRTTGEYLGLVGASVPTEDFFEHYGNIHDINSQFLVAFDKRGIILAVGADQRLVGHDYFGKVVQDFVNHNPILNAHTSKMLEEQSGYTMYDYGKGERLTTYQPIYVTGRPTYFVQIVTPTASIYSQIDPILLQKSSELALFLVASIATSAVLVIFLLLWSSSLKKEVLKRTSELDESNRLLAATNKQLERRDHLQREFINVAAHEMRTPIQPILGMSEMLYEKISDLQNKILPRQMLDNRNSSTTFVAHNHSEGSVSKSAEILSMLEVIARNAKRLNKLSDNLLDVSRIENKSFKLDKEILELNEKIRGVISDIRPADQEVNIVFEPWSENIIVKVDKIRIFEVISNLIVNAIKFTKGGTITVRSKVQEGYASVTITDTGPGIDPDIMSRLFTLFAARSEKGMGLGLYISKKIVEAHGGIMWGENNADGRGATFGFTLPVL
jgi:signal transduction histidine kinase